ncbi:CAP domain-containing protein [Hoeflea sp. BAL378]|uniref:CAP domain-containing protein n=1 Tax=Hoeflea sp. BAL378 TaxID=1547437 RepID=UPI000AB2C7FD|nr:CAP domain-containing protein [Hoeflea sp. BAL378]
MIARLTLLLALLLPLPALAQTQDNLAALAERSLALVNAARQAEGLESLEFEDELSAAALAHARDMLARDYFAHTSPGGGTVLDRYLKAGGDDGRVVRENLSKCDGCRDRPDVAAIEAMHEGWMNSPGHRANILAEGLAGFGFAVVQDNEGTRYGVQTFAGPGAPRGKTPDGSVTAIGPEQQTRVAAGIINGLRADAGPVEADSRLRRHVEAKLAAAGAGAKLSGLGLLRDLPADLPFLSYQVLSGQCGGCGSEPTDADVHFFLESWSGSPRSRKILRDKSLTSIGFVIVADGEGRKTAALLLAGE